MHGYVSVEEHLHHVAPFLCGYYVFIAAMNGLAALYLWRQRGAAELCRFPRWFPVVGGQPFTDALLWLIVAMFFAVLAPLAASGDPVLMRWVSLPGFMQELVNRAMSPTMYTLLSVALFFFFYFLRRFFAQPIVAWSLLNVSLLLMGLSMPNVSFAAIVMKPDNVPIVGLIFLLGYFTWLATYKANLNDDRLKQGLEPLEKLDDEKVLVWPDLVYTELICMVGLTALMILWAVALQAPLEEPASSVKTPNPSKAPWYFLGLQEMLVYYDPWMAGVVLPSVVVFGLMAIPFLDFNKQGNGYYTIEQRQFAYITFQFGFLVLWVTLIVMGTFLRGPNWNFYGPYELWDPHKVEALNNVDLSEYFWIYGLGMGRPKPPDDAGLGLQLAWIALRESPGILLTIAYFVLIPPYLAATLFRSFFVRMGFLRFMIMANLLLLMALLPLKMVLRWTFNLKYFIAIPEYFLNF